MIFDSYLQSRMKEEYTFCFVLPSPYALGHFLGMPKHKAAYAFLCFLCVCIYLYKNETVNS